MSKLTRVDSGGSAVIYRGDPRLAESDMDGWLRTLLEHNPVEAYKRPYLWGSDAGFCARRNVLLEHNVWLDANINAAGTAYMAIGVALEDLLAKALKRSHQLIVQGMRLPEMPELKISAKADLFIWDCTDELALVEVKTCGDLPPEPKPAHLAQVQMYAAMSGMRNVWLTYISRNLNPKQPMSTRTFQVDTSDDALADKLRIAFLSRFASDLGRTPPVPAHFRKHTECHYCEFRDHFCHGHRPGNGGEAAQPPLPELNGSDLISLDLDCQAAAHNVLVDYQVQTKRTVQALIHNCTHLPHLPKLQALLL